MKVEKENLTKAIPSGGYMPLCKVINGKKTNKSWLINHYDLWLSKVPYSQNTCTTYIKCVKKLLDEVDFDNPRLSNLDIERYLVGKRPLNFSAAKSFVSYLYYEFNKKFIDITYPKVIPKESKEKEILSTQDINKLISALPDNFKFQTKFIYDLALRVSEIYRLKVSSIRWNDWIEDNTQFGVITIKKTKGKKKREMLVSPELMLETFNYIKSRDGKVMPDNFLFNFRTGLFFKRQMRKKIKDNVGIFLNLDEKRLREYREEAIWHHYITKNVKYYQTLIRKASLKVLFRRSHPHALRASKATHLHNNGASLIEIRDYLGHESTATTQLYIKTGLSDQEKMLKKVSHKIGAVKI